MKYSLETIPVWEAYEAGAECPLCFLSERLERQYVSFYLGDSVMAPEIRVQVNKTGFCGRHFHQMLESGNRLGLALLASTHLEELSRVLEREGESLEKSTGAGGSARKRFRNALSDMRTRRDECLVCRRIEHSLSNYCFTIAKLYIGEAQFREAFDASRGLCLKHLPMLLEVAHESLRGGDLKKVVRASIDATRSDISGTHEALGEFSGRFDYRSTGPVTDSMKGSVPRAVRKIAGKN